MKNITDLINEGRTSKTVSFTEYQALMLRDFLRDCDYSNFGTKEDRQDLEKAIQKINNMVDNW